MPVQYTVRFPQSAFLPEFCLVRLLEHSGACEVQLIANCAVRSLSATSSFKLALEWVHGFS